MAAAVVSVPPSGASVGSEGSRASATLVFESNRSEQKALYALDLSGGPLRRLVAGEQPSWSPDGTMLLFRREDRNFRSSLWLMRASGNGLRVLVPRAPSRANGGGSWSPDGSMIAVAPFGPEGLRIVSVSTGKERLLPSPPEGSSDGDPSWSPDGTWIAFFRSRPSASGPRESALMIVHPDGSGLRRVASRTFEATWSPDGSKLAFQSGGPNGTGRWDSHEYVWSVDGGPPRLLRGVPGTTVAWSPDGRWLAFVGAAPPGVSYLEIVHPDGSGLRRVFGFGQRSVVSGPVWSPGSQRLAVTVGPPFDLWVVGLDGHARVLTQGWRYGYSSGAPVWRPPAPAGLPVGGRVVDPAIPSDSAVNGDVLMARRPILALAADGERVAIAYAATSRLHWPSACIEVWTAGTGTPTRFFRCVSPSTPDSMHAPLPSFSLALAGHRLLLSQGSHGLGVNFYQLETATLQRPNPITVAGVCRPGTSACIREPIGDLAAAGTLAVFDSWAGPQFYCNEPCPLPRRNGRLFRVDDTSAVQIATAGDGGELTPLAVDAAGILVRLGDNRLALVGPDGATRLTLDAPGFSEAAVEGSDLVATVPSGLLDADSATGAIKTTCPLPPDAHLAGVANGLSVYSTAASTDVLRLSDCRSAQIGPAPAAPALARLTTAGLFYAQTIAEGPFRSSVTFVPNATLSAKVGG